MILTIALGIVAGFLFLALLPYIIALIVGAFIGIFYILGWIWEKITK